MEDQDTLDNVDAGKMDRNFRSPQKVNWDTARVFNQLEPP